MASTTPKKTCAKCNKGGGTAICYGCQEAFCTKHFIEHRQELSQQMDDIGQEHDVLHRDLTNEQGTHPLLAHIDQWEQESIIKIQTTAKLARIDLQKLLNQAKSNLQKSVSKMAEELQSSRESDDYTELDIKKWTAQLQAFRKILDNPTSVKIDYENDSNAAIRLIKVNDQQSSNSFYQIHKADSQISRNFETPVKEKFVETSGDIELSQDGLVAVCLAGNEDRSCASGIGRYSSGVHAIRIRIARWKSFYPFLGIVNCSENIKNNPLKSTSRYGWYDLDYFVVGGNLKSKNDSEIIQAGDEVNLILDCNNREIQLEHPRTQRKEHIPVDLQLCPFPWKFIVLLRLKDDCIRSLR